MTTSERWAQIEELFHRTSECDPQERDRILAKIGDSEIRHEVEALLDSEKSATRDLDSAVLDGLDAVIFPLDGATVSHYRILGGLGVGGMGLLYRAEDIRLGRKVALKFLLEESAKDPAALGRFEREARSISALEHPNICPVYEFGEHEGQPFLVMPLLEGHTLLELISARGRDKAPPEISKMLDFAIQIASGLDAAHRHRIIHRDIKPANLFVTTEGQIKILDFGLAKLRQPEILERMAVSGTREIEQPPDASVTFTRSGVAMGTAGYMSPEQVRGEELDARTDVFSFGVVLYEMATGQPAFSGETAAVRYQAILNDTPTSARKLNSEVPLRLETILNKALMKDRAARYQTVSEMRADLEALKRSSESKHRRVALALAALGMIALVGAVFWFTRHQTLMRALPEITQRQLTANSAENIVGASAISPNGHYLAYCDQDGLHVEVIQTSETRTVPQEQICKGGPDDWSLAWFPDNTTLLASGAVGKLQSVYDFPGDARPGIWSIPLNGGPIRELRDDADAASISPNGSLVAFATNQGDVGNREIWLMGADGSHARKLFETDEQSDFENIRWSPDGRRLTFVKNHISTHGFEEPRLESRDLNGGPAELILSPAPLDYDWVSRRKIIIAQMPGPSWTGYSLRYNFWDLQADPRTGQPEGEPRQLTDWAGFFLTNLSATADGKQLAFQRFSEQFSSYVADVSGKGTHITAPKRITLVEGKSVGYTWTPDSKAMIVHSDRNGAWGIYKQSLEKDTAEPIVTGLPHESMIRACPKNASLFYWVPAKQSSHSGQEAIMNLMNVPIAGGAPRLVLSSDPDWWLDVSCANSPAKLCVLLEVNWNSREATFTSLDPLKGRGRELFKLGGFSRRTWRWGWNVLPDGRGIAVIGSNGTISILSLDGRLLKEIVPKGWTYIFSFDRAADGNGWFTVGRTRQGQGLLHVDLDGKAHLLWREEAGLRIVSGIPSPDGRHLVISVISRPSSNIWMIENF